MPKFIVRAELAYTNGEMVRYIEAPDLATAQRKAAEDPELRNPEVEEGPPQFTGYRQLVAWLKENKISPQQAKVAVASMCINEPPEYNCPECDYDLHKGMDIDARRQIYSCPRCKTVIQVG